MAEGLGRDAGSSTRKAFTRPAWRSGGGGRCG